MICIKLFVMDTMSKCFMFVCFNEFVNHFNFRSNNPDLFHISILTLPSPTSCIHCLGALPSTEGIISE